MFSFLFYWKVILSDSLALSQLPRFTPDPSADLASFGKILSAVPAQLIDYEVQNPEGQKCSVATWLRQVILALVKDPAYHIDEILSILSRSGPLSWLLNHQTLHSFPIFGWMEDIETTRWHMRVSRCQLQCNENLTWNLQIGCGVGCLSCLYEPFLKKPLLIETVTYQKLESCNLSTIGK